MRQSFLNNMMGYKTRCANIIVVGLVWTFSTMGCYKIGYANNKVVWSA